MSSGPILLSKLTWGLSRNLQKFSRGDVGSVAINISPSNIFQTMVLPKRFKQNCQTVCELCERRFAKTAPDCIGPSMAEWRSLGKVTVTSLLMGNSQGKVHDAMAIIKGRPKGYLHMLNNDVK